MLAPGTAFAATNPPVADQQVSSYGSNSTSVTVTTSQSEVWVAYVSADGPSDSAQSATVTVGGSGWTKQASSSYGADQYAPGYAGIFSTGSNLSAGTRTITATVGDTGYYVWLTVVTYSSASGLEGAEGEGGNSTGYCPQNSAQTLSANNKFYMVGHDWENAITPSAYYYPDQTIDASQVDTTMGDTSWLQHLNAASPTGGEDAELSLSNGCDDSWNTAGVWIDGS